MHLSDLGKGLTIGSRKDKGGSHLPRTVGTAEGGRAGVGGNLDSTCSVSAWGDGGGSQGPASSGKFLLGGLRTLHSPSDSHLSPRLNRDENVCSFKVITRSRLKASALCK